MKRKQLFTATICMLMLLSMDLFPFGGEPKEEEKTNLAQREQTYNYYSKVPERYGHKMSLASPQHQLETSQETVVVSGSNRYLSPTYINGNEVTLDSEGNFSETISLNRGKQSVIVSFSTPEHALVNIKRDLIRLIGSHKLLGTEEKKQLLYFRNSSFVADLPYDHMMLTRASLAYFVARLQGWELGMKTKGSQFIDVPQDHWAADAIDKSITSQIMAEFPDGKFRPDEPVKRIEYIVTVVRALGLPTQMEEASFPYRDVDHKSWVAKFINSAFKHHLIYDKNELEPNGSVTFLEFSHLALNVPDVKTEIESRMDFSIGFNVTDKFEQDKLDPIAFGLIQRKKDDLTTQKINVIQPEDMAYTFESHVNVFGHARNSTPIQINDIATNRGEDGQFSVDIQLDIGKNNISVQSGEDKKIIS
ncbi:MAG: S-layer homology domain-containing protein, partial [Candidatus Margulisbacteria bacterium]|nr:S-layer homology domain-containing protein [Candidatus Margulisiibacteriota bacterium]